LKNLLTAAEKDKANDRDDSTAAANDHLARIHQFKFPTKNLVSTYPRLAEAQQIADEASDDSDDCADNHDTESDMSA